MSKKTVVGWAARLAVGLSVGGAIGLSGGAAHAQAAPQQQPGTIYVQQPVYVVPAGDPSSLPPPPQMGQQPVPQGYVQPPQGYVQQPPQGYVQPPQGYVQQPPPGYQLAPGAMPNAEAQELYRSGRRLRGPGKALTITGAVLLPVGMIVAVAGALGGLVTLTTGCHSSSGSSCNDNLTGAGLAFYGGVGMSMIGTALLGTGIPLWAVGQSRMNRAVEMGGPGVAGLSLSAPRLQLQPLYSPTGTGLVGGMAGLSFQM
jgi:hypothetical protein